MDKHYLGKHLTADVVHNDIKFKMTVFKGYNPDNMPNVKLSGGTVHISLASSKKEFDENIIETLNEVQATDDVFVICPTDAVYEYAFTRLKELSS